jgi:hypothetical protein
MTRRHLSIFGPDDELVVEIPLTDEQADKIGAMLCGPGEPVGEYEVLAFFGETRDGE